MSFLKTGHAKLILSPFLKQLQAVNLVSAIDVVYIDDSKTFHNSPMIFLWPR